jgi:Fe-S-cluster containining protein
MESLNMCHNCPALCCRIPAALTSYDILRIARATGMEVNDFVVYYHVDKDEFGFKSLDQKMEFYLKRPKERCVFLKEDPHFHCAIEQYKPAVCLSYPFSIRGKETHLRRDALCLPKNLKKADFQKMSAHVLDECQWELAQYSEVVDDWNATASGGETPEQFLRFSLHELDLAQKPLIGSHLRRLRSRVRKILKQ